MIERSLLRSSVSRFHARCVASPQRAQYHVCYRLRRSHRETCLITGWTNPNTIRTIAKRTLTTTTSRRIGILDSSDQKPTKPAPHTTEPTPLSDDQYHEIADEFLEDLQYKLEQLQEERTDLEVEFASGVLNIDLPSQGTYVLNKQPPNKQIWLSSPVSGPKRYDWVAEGNSMNDKEGTAKGDWIYLRDGSSLTALLRDEIGVKVETEATGG